MKFDCRVLSVYSVQKKLKNTTDQLITVLHVKLSGPGYIVGIAVSQLKVEMMESESHVSKLQDD